MIASYRIMKLTSYLFLLLLLTSCTSNNEKTQPFNSIDFSYFDISPEAFSLRITRHDSVFLKQYFSANNVTHLKDSITYVSLLKGDIKEQFDNLIAIVNFSKLDSV